MMLCKAKILVNFQIGLVNLFLKHGWMIQFQLVKRLGSLRRQVYHLTYCSVVYDTWDLQEFEAKNMQKLIKELT